MLQSESRKRRRSEPTEDIPSPKKSEATKTPYQVGLLDLPSELLSYILDFLPRRDTYEMLFFNRTMNAIATHHHLYNTSVIDREKFWPKIHKLLPIRRSAATIMEQKRLACMDRFTWDMDAIDYIPSTVRPLKMLHVVWKMSDWNNDLADRKRDLFDVLTRFQSTLRCLVITTPRDSDSWNPERIDEPGRLIIDDRRGKLNFPSTVSLNLDTLVLHCAARHNKSLVADTAHSIKHLIIRSESFLICSCYSRNPIKFPELRLICAVGHTSRQHIGCRNCMPKVRLIATVRSAFTSEFRSRLDELQIDVMIDLLHRVDKFKCECSTCEFEVVTILIDFLKRLELPKIPCLPRHTQKRTLYVKCSEACREALRRHRYPSLRSKSRVFASSITFVFSHRPTNVSVTMSIDSIHYAHCSYCRTVHRPTWQ
jgi:hypothetical protein